MSSIHWFPSLHLSFFFFFLSQKVTPRCLWSGYRFRWQKPHTPTRSDIWRFWSWSSQVHKEKETYVGPTS
jgi:hypothetical protein